MTTDERAAGSRVPSPPLEELIAKWRDAAHGLYLDAHEEDMRGVVERARYCDGKAQALRFAADELEAALRAAVAAAQEPK